MLCYYAETEDGIVLNRKPFNGPASAPPSGHASGNNSRNPSRATTPCNKMQYTPAKY